MHVHRYDTYETSAKFFSDYRLIDKTDNFKGIAENENIEVIYYYELKEVENPNTADPLVLFIIICAVSLFLLIFQRNIKKHIKVYE